MKFIKIFSFLFVLFIFSKTTAQEFKLGKVSVAELEQKTHPKDSSAAASVLYKKGTATIEYNEQEGFVLITHVEARIKIYKKEGYDWANQSVIYYNVSNDSREKVDFSDVCTFNLVNGKIEKTKLKSDGIFNEVVNKYRARKKITMPNVKEGSILEYSYTIRTSNIGMMREWAFQTSIPVNYSEYKTQVPEYYTYNVYRRGTIKINETSFGVDYGITFDSKFRIENELKFSSKNISYPNTNLSNSVTTYSQFSNTAGFSYLKSEKTHFNVKLEPYVASENNLKVSDIDLLGELNVDFIL